ncbi:MAG: NAD(+) diphosphatase [Mesorhizobium sp.]|nr:MAG: NAD(+) diphosphatase [Mesorhizobium sp.]
MNFRLFDAPLREPSQFVGFAGNRIDRQSENRADDAVEKALGERSARLMLMHGGRLYLKLDDGKFDPWFEAAESQAFEVSLDGGVLLGLSESGPVLAVPAGIEPENLPETVKAIDYRSVYMQGLIDEAAAGALAQGAALLAWHASHAFCSKCGNRSEMRAGGYRRHCPACGTDHFPRTEPGETIEAAVRRETLEEAGIRLGRVVYHASQPWPFPYSLMIGCFGEPLNEDIQADLNELEDCRWFFRDEVRSMLERTHPGGLITPPKGAIAHHLIRAWVDSE